jgi:hypothetical protein
VDQPSLQLFPAISLVPLLQQVAWKFNAIDCGQQLAPRLRFTHWKGSPGSSNLALEACPSSIARQMPEGHPSVPGFRGEDGLYKILELLDDRLCGQPSDYIGTTVKQRTHRQ